MTESLAPATVSFTRMADGTKEDYELIHRQRQDLLAALPDRVLEHLKLLANSTGGAKVTTLEHSLQTATRAQRDGRDEEYVVCAVLHDIGDSMACYNHAELSATVLEPFVSEQNHWMVKHHGLFQGYYYFHHYGADRDARDKYKGHPHYDHTAEFCELYDQAAFDPDYETLPLDFFAPMVKRVLAQPKRSLYGWTVKEAAEVT